MSKYIIAYKKKKLTKIKVSGVEEYAQANYVDSYTGANGIYTSYSDKEDGTQSYISSDGNFIVSRVDKPGDTQLYDSSYWYIRRKMSEDTYGGDFYTDGILTEAGPPANNPDEISKIPFLADGSSASWRFQSGFEEPAAGVSVVKIE